MRYKDDTRLTKRGTLLNLLDMFLGSSPVASNISYLWSFGSLLGLTLISQIVTGISLSFHYQPHIAHAFDSVESIMRNENFGWILRYSHANGAGLFFILVYIHISRNLYYGSYKEPRILLWTAGVIIYVLMMATAFIGYVLVWGSMSLWGAIVITNLFSAVPWLGGELVKFIWGGFSVDNPTLNRFYGLHFTLPFLIAGMVVVHLIGLHDHGSNNPAGVESANDKSTFHPYFTFKDLVGFVMLFLVGAILVGYYPNILGHADNYIAANPLVTPSSIVPEFYFLPFYAILRSIPDKQLGVVAMGLSIAGLFALPFINPTTFRASHFDAVSRWSFWLFAGNFLTLLLIGGLPVEDPYVIMGQCACCAYFFLLYILPLLYNRFSDAYGRFN